MKRIVYCGWRANFRENGCNYDCKCHNLCMIKGTMFYGGEKELRFGNLSRLTIQADGKLWRYDHHTQTDMIFTVVEFGQDGIGNWVRQWRERGRLTQTKAARVLGVSQSLIARIEAGKRGIQEDMYWKIRGHVSKHGRKRIPPSALKRKARKPGA
jgi:hypothetical protein